MMQAPLVAQSRPGAGELDQPRVAFEHETLQLLRHRCGIGGRPHDVQQRLERHRVAAVEHRDPLLGSGDLVVVAGLPRCSRTVVSSCRLSKASVTAP